MNIFWEKSFSSFERLLGLMDKNPMSPQYGCFHREFWHQRLCDFPSASRQQGVLCLSLVWEAPNSSYYHSSELLEFIEAGMLFTCKIQKSDGSFDEWYPQERGWAGPTGYVIHALARSYEICQSSLKPQVKEMVLKTLEKGAHFLGKGWEEHILFNHIAMALLPIYQVYKISGKETHLRDYQELWQKFKKYWNQDEGWGIEYDGPDVGYQSATISFLARLHFYSKDEEIKEICQKSFEFINYFCFPDGSFARRLGCRQTETLFHFGPVYWSGQGIEDAGALLRWDTSSLSNNRQLIPSDHDDHYFIYRMLEFLEAAVFLNKMGNPSVKEKSLPFEGELFKKHFEKGGLYIQKDEFAYSAINLKRGGHLVSFPVKGEAVIDSGILLKTAKGQHLTSLEWDNSYRIELGKTLKVSGRLQQWHQPTFTPLKMILFRISLLVFGRHKTSAYWLKVLIRKILLKKDKRSDLRFTRTIYLNDKPRVESEVFGESKEDQIVSYYTGGIFDIRFVPQSRYFKEDDLRHLPKRIR